MIPGAKLPFEIGGPQIVRVVGHRRNDARMCRRPAHPSAVHKAAARQEIGDRARGGPLADPWMLGLQHHEQLPRGPVGMRLACCDQELRQRRGEFVRARVRGATQIPSPRRPSSAYRAIHL